MVSVADLKDCQPNEPKVLGPNYHHSWQASLWTGADHPVDKNTDRMGPICFDTSPVTVGHLSITKPSLDYI